MAEMLKEGAGLLVNPGDIAQLVKAVCSLLEDRKRQIQLGKRARFKVLADHESETIGQRMEQVYADAIDSRKHLGSR